jgi:hypothetical protein
MTKAGYVKAMHLPLNPQFALGGEAFAMIPNDLPGSIDAELDGVIARVDRLAARGWRGCVLIRSPRA